MITFTGLTWSHPRGHAPLAALAALAAGDGPLAVGHSRMVWRAQDLAGFESHPIDALTDRYDVIVLDHPGLGAATGALLPLDDAFDADELSTWRGASVAGSYDSYAYGGHQWALPVDAAAQVCAFRPDLLGARPPETWEAALRLGRGTRIAVPTAGPHTLLTFLGIAAAHDPSFRPDDRRLVPREIALAAYDTLRRAIERTPPRLRGLDPIGLLDRMAGESIAYIPLVFGYVGYSADGLIRFADAPSLRPAGVPGSVLGGTGLAVAARLRGDPLVLDHLRQAMHPLAQCRVVPDAGGQPGSAAAWDDPAINAAWGDFYRATRRSVDHAWRRPRFPGWISVQTGGSAILRDAVAGRRRPAEALDALDTCFRSHHRPEAES